MSQANFEHIYGPVYVVKNAKGFDQAVKHFDKHDSHERLDGRPTNFPSMVVFTEYTSSDEVLCANCEHLTLVKAKLEKC